MMTLREVLNKGSAFLRNAGIESYALDAALLLAKVLNTNRTRLLIDAENHIGECNCKIYYKLLQRRANHECTAYITNSKDFRFLELYVNKNVLLPRPDTETLVEAAICRIDELKKMEKEIYVLDMCTGSGAVALSLKYERPFINMYASDISAAALSVAKRNAEKYQLQDDVCFIQSDTFENITKRFDIIVSNAPYIPSALIKTLRLEVQNEPLIALDGGIDGLEIIRQIISSARKYLLLNGCVFLEAAPEQMHEIKNIFIAGGFYGIDIKRDLSGAARVICAMV
ncbi:MAG: peptide chain release factor N(5)-glutamine methyltransferase [Spirochaetaceae bacterium]|jgi:release factor glutamine methyltransferase|nr:peptide chain release factor N(5)-glutamine methyltransferase [Spirochaetaceae bacterium]